MRPRTLLAVAALVCGHAASAGAASLFFTGTLTHELSSVFSPVTFNGSGVATSAGGGFSLPANAFMGTETATTPSYVPPPITGNEHILQGHGPGSFSGSPFGGSMPLAGRVRVLAYSNLQLFEIRFADTGGAVGAGGTFSYPGPGGGITVHAAAWTTGFQSFPTFPTISNGTPTLAGFDNRNAKGVGTTRLVTYYTADIATGGTWLGLLTLDLNFVPEPAGVALGGAALLLALAGVGRRRARGA